MLEITEQEKHRNFGIIRRGKKSLYVWVTPSEFWTAIGDMDKRQQNDVTLITESGYYMLVKSFTDDLSWDVQRQLVNTYFRAQL